MLVAMTVAPLAACHGVAAEMPAPPPVAAAALGVKAVAPSTKLHANVLRATGQVRAKSRATLSAPLTGTLRRVLVEEGDRVRKGQLLAQLDTDGFRIGVEQARAGLALASASLDGATVSVKRARRLAAAASIPIADLDKAEVALRQAEAQQAQATASLHQAEHTLEDASIVAPFAGVITSRLKDTGDTVSLMPPTPIFELVNVDDVEIRALIPESVIERVSPGARIRGTVSPSGKVFEAVISNRGAVVDSQSRTIQVLADVVAQSDGATRATLRPGSLVDLDLSTAGPQTAGLFLPTQAIAVRDGKAQVVVVREGRARHVAIKAEQVLPGTMRVLEGLKEEDRVVADLSVPIAEGRLLQVAKE